MTLRFVSGFHLHRMSTDAQHWEIQFKTWMFTFKGQENLNLKFNLDYIWTKFEGFEVFLKKMLRYLMVVSGGSFLLGGLNKDTRRCFLRCLQVSSSSSLLLNIEFWLVVRITSFSVRYRSHERPPLENGWPLALMNQFTKLLDSLILYIQMYEDSVVWHLGIFLKHVLCLLHLFLNSFSVKP